MEQLEHGIGFGVQKINDNMLIQNGKYGQSRTQKSADNLNPSALKEDALNLRNDPSQLTLASNNTREPNSEQPEFKKKVSPVEQAIN